GLERTFTTPPYSQFSEVPSTLPAMTYGVAAWGDFDRDGRLDLFLAGYTNSSYNWGCYLLHNEGNSSFTALPNAPGGTFAGSSPWGDFDNDNNLDLLLDTGIYRNNSNGVFTTAFSFPLAFIRSLNWVDYDNDGRADVDFCGELLPNDNVASYLFHND